MEPIILPRPHETRVRAPRLRVAQTLVVEAATIGTAINYPMVVENISRSGMLLSWESLVRIPFIENTIVDMVIDAEDSVLGKPIKCLGKIVRRTNAIDNDNRATTFGVRIVQMDVNDLERWENFIMGQEGQNQEEAVLAETMLPLAS